eukprot:3146794-Amphidinium_carterae.1
MGQNMKKGEESSVVGAHLAWNLRVLARVDQPIRLIHVVLMQPPSTGPPCLKFLLWKCSCKCGLDVKS